MSIRVRFACGHQTMVSLTATDVRCHCGETHVVHTEARAPRFVGACSGPYAETKALEPIAVPLATGAPLIVKPQDGDA